MTSIFSNLYQFTLSKAQHPLAVLWLCILTFLESVIFPVPVDVMLAPMMLATPHRIWILALFTTLSSVLGAMAGYLLGYLAYDWFVFPLLERMDYLEHFATAQHWFELYGVAAVLVASVTPIPFKIFTLAAGVVHQPFLTFVMACLVGRALRYYLVGVLCYFCKSHIDSFVMKYVDRIGWLMLASLVGLWLIVS